MTHLRLSVLLFALAPSAFAQSPSPLTPPADAAERVKAIFAAYDRPDSPGCVVGVSIAGKQVLRGAWGTADLEHRVPLTPDSISEAGSISKQFTAAAILLLVEQGKLALTDPVSKYIPELPAPEAAVTLDQLIHHTSGLRDWGSVVEAGGWPRTTREYTNPGVLDIMTRQRALNYTPGTAWSYTNTGFNLLAIVVGRVTGKSLAEFTHDNIFAPLGMNSTSWRDDFRRVVPNRAIAYERVGGSELQLMPFEDTYGHGGLLTTVDDLLRWNDRYAHSAIGGPGFVKSELQLGRYNDGSPLFYAAGLFISTHDGLREISHAGATAGYRAWLGYYPDPQLSVALLCNSTEFNTTLLGHKVADIYLAPPAPPPAPELALPVALDGLYESRRDHTTIAIARKDGKVIANGKYLLLPATATSFRTTPDGNLYEIVKDASGHVTALNSVSYGATLDTLDRVAPATPARAEMQAMAGDYVSDEAETTFTVVLTPTGLVIHQRPDTVYVLTPTYAGGFNSEIGSIRFLHKVGGHFTELSLGSARLWDLRFRRVGTK